MWPKLETNLKQSVIDLLESDFDCNRFKILHKLESARVEIETTVYTYDSHFLDYHMLFTAKNNFLKNNEDETRWMSEEDLDDYKLRFNDLGTYLYGIKDLIV